MLNARNYLLPALVALLFVGLSQLPHGCFYFMGIVLVANLVGNRVGGEFTNDQIRHELAYFERHWGARLVKLLSAFILLGMIGWCLVYVDSGRMTTPELVGFSVVTGFLTGCFIVTLAHELLHGNTRFERSVANVLLVVAGIPHFTNDHLLGHHRTVGLAQDETTAKLGDSFYTYFRKAAWQRIHDSYSACYTNLPDRVCQSVRRQNITLALCLGLVYTVLAVWSRHSALTLMFFAIQGFTAYVLYELINYIQHYGLRRRIQENGKPEPVGIEHAWNCYYKYSNYLLFMLPLHSVHHACPHPRPGMNLMGPRLPYAYFVMVAIALVPGLWFKLMNPLVRRQRAVDLVAA